MTQKTANQINDLVQTSRYNARYAPFAHANAYVHTNMIDSMSETVETLRSRSVRSGVKALAVSLDVPPTLLYDILGGRYQHVSQERHMDLRRRLGLSYEVTRIVKKPAPPAWVSRAADWLAAREKEMHP